MKNRTTLTVIVTLLIGLLSCTHGHQQHGTHLQLDTLLQQSYRLRYTDVDSSIALARAILSHADGDLEYKARAYNALAFGRYHFMDYDGAILFCDSVYNLSHNQVVLLAADVMKMKVYQRIGDGGGFYKARSSAQRRLKRIAEELSSLPDTEREFYNYCQTEFHIICSTYYYYEEQDSLSRLEMELTRPIVEENADTTQLLNYLYMMGSGGMVDGTFEEVIGKEFDYLINCFAIALRSNIKYFAGNALQALATRLKTPYERQIVRERYFDAYNMLFVQHLMWMDGDMMHADSLFTTALSQHALAIFKDYNDLFQMACVHRTIGEIAFYNHNYESSLESYQSALDCVSQHHNTFYPKSKKQLLVYDETDTTATSIERQWIEDPSVSTLPEWMAGIRQQLSITYSAMELKTQSDYNRNIYLDILESTTQNREMESRMTELQDEMDVQHKLIWAAGTVLALLMVLFIFILFQLKPHTLMNRESLKATSQVDQLRILKDDKRRVDELSDYLEELEEECTASKLRIAQNKIRNAEKRAKVSLVQAITPFLDRILNEVSRIKRNGSYSAEQVGYICELSDQIVEYNNILTEWIQMEKGQLSLQISTIELSELFSILEKGHFSFDQQGVQLVVKPVDLRVKADEALTMFMLNTLADNARKFTPKGGTVTVYAEPCEKYVEISVQDTGCGMTEEDIDTILNNKVYDASQIGKDHNESKGFGFGLMNCKGIIEKYKKTSNLFSVCHFGIESTVGRGSRFFFRLPRVLTIFIISFFVSLTAFAQGKSSKARYYYERVYECNVNGYYEDAILYADSALYECNPAFVLYDSSVNDGNLPLDIEAFRKGEEYDYLLIIQLRNEIAIAALALNDLELYNYNNRICINLHKLYNQDTSLPFYYDMLQKAKSTSQQIIVSLVILSLISVIMTYLLFRGRRRKAKNMIDNLQQNVDEQQDVLSHSKFEETRLYVQNQVLDNCLSTIKHESMYYPSRIRQLVTNEQIDIAQLDELSSYYKQMYTLLSGQAERQVSVIGQRREDIVIEEFIGKLNTIFQKIAKAQNPGAALSIDNYSCPSTIVKADYTILQELFRQLFIYLCKRVEGSTTFHLKVENEDPYLRFTVSNNDLQFSTQESHDLFYPDVNRIPLLVVKQILRDIDSLNNNPGLRLVAETDRIWFTIPAPLTRR